MPIANERTGWILILGNGVMVMQYPVLYSVKLRIDWAANIQRKHLLAQKLFAGTVQF